MAFDYNIFWTHEAVSNIESIINHLNEGGTPNETEDFRDRLSRQLGLIQQNPYLFPISMYNSRLRKAVLSQQITLVYEVAGQIIYLVNLFSHPTDNETTKR